MNGRPKIVIVGGGAGGAELAARLGRRLGRRKRADVTLIDESLTHVWKPLLHEVAAGTLDSHEDDIDYLALARKWGFRFWLGTMTGLDRAQRRVELAPIIDEQGSEVVHARSLPYDYLVIAVGSITNDFGTPGAREHCRFLDNRDQADAFQQELIRNYLRAQAQGAALREAQLNVAIVGGGATGVELAAELHRSARQLVAYGLDRIRPEQDVKLSVIEAGERILSGLPPRISAAAEARLRELGIAVHTSQRVTQVSGSGLETHTGLVVPAEMKVWAAGIKAPAFLSRLGLETNPINQIIVHRTLQSTVDGRVFALGDCAHCPQPGTDTPVPPRAQAAHQQAALLARSLDRILRSKPALQYTYRDYGSLISLSRYDAVGNLMGNLTGNVMIEGALARLMYRWLYKSHRIALLGRMPVLLETLGGVLTRPTRPRLKLH